jgi:hypothetical protein
MLHSISWKQFMGFIAWAAIIYYLWVGVRFYRRDIVDLLMGKRGKRDNDNKNKNI